MNSQSTLPKSSASKIFLFFSTLGLIVFCFAVGEVSAIFVTSFAFGLDMDELLRALREPSNVERDVLLSWVVLSALFRFFTVPGAYLVITNKRSLSFMWGRNRVRGVNALLVVALFISLVPCISVLIEFNSTLKLPSWLGEIGTYFKKSEARAQLLMGKILSTQGLQALTVNALVVAVIPGIVEELFFRGIVQTRLYNVFNNPGYAILSSSALFSFFHFQFYGFIPRLALGILLGYLFFRSGNIWYPIIAHISNNLLGVLTAYFMGIEVLEPISDKISSNVLLIPSIVISAFLMWMLTKTKWNGGHGASVRNNLKSDKIKNATQS